MKSDPDQMVPIMTNSESILQLGNNAYGKPATALNILRETVMGRELFDYSFKIYANRWKFKHPTPADFFRTMEDASATDLDWFFRGWFYTTYHVDISMDNVQHFVFSDFKPEAANTYLGDEDSKKFIGYKRNDSILSGSTVVDKDDEMKDFYNKNDGKISKADQRSYDEKINSLTDTEKALLNSGYNFYQIDFSNVGGLVMPVIVEFTFSDNSTEVVRMPAEIWIGSEENFSKVFAFKKEVKSVELDPFLETADTDRDNNYWPPKSEPTRFELYQAKKRSAKNPMQEAGN